MLTNEELRKIVINNINQRSRDNFRKKRESLQQYLMYEYESKELIAISKDMEMTKEEISAELGYILADSDPEKIKNENERLIERAKDLIDIAYKDNKWEGREVSGLLSLLFHRISPELGAKFETS